MTWIVILASLGWCLVVVETWNLHRALKHGVIRFRLDWRRDTDPGDFWLFFSGNAFALLFGAALALIRTYLIVSSFHGDVLLQ